MNIIGDNLCYLTLVRILKGNFEVYCGYYYLHLCSKTLGFLFTEYAKSCIKFSCLSYIKEQKMI